MSRVLITRPDGQAQALAETVRTAGYQPVLSPALVIEPQPLSDADRRRLLDLDQYHAVFFVSVNAARLALEAMEDLWPQWPVGVHWLAVGEATARAVGAFGLSAETPKQGFNSEAVLALPCLSEVRERRILVCRGDRGRDWLATQLRQRGAEVTVMPFYRRLANPAFHWPPGTDAVMVTSVEGWHAIADQVPARALAIAAGGRVAKAVAADHGGPLITARSAHDVDMMAALRTGC